MPIYVYRAKCSLGCSALTKTSGEGLPFITLGGSPATWCGGYGFKNNPQKGYA